MILNNEKKLNPMTKSAGVEQEFQKIAGKEASSVLQELGCTANGISDEEREERLEKYGYNDLSAMQVQNCSSSLNADVRRISS